jgi:hypothetical protein
VAGASPGAAGRAGAPNWGALILIGARADITAPPELATGSNSYEHLASVNDLLLARATFAAAIKRCPNAKITLRNGARIIEKTWAADN